MGENAHIGFHAARAGDSNFAISPHGDAVVGAYLCEIGVRDVYAIIYLTNASPHSMTWMRQSDAASHKIPVTPFSLSDDKWSWDRPFIRHLPKEHIYPIGASVGKGQAAR